MDGQDATAGTDGQAARPEAADGAGSPAPAPVTGRGSRTAAAGTALALVAAAGTALGAVLLHPGHSLLAKSGGPLDSTAAVVLLALAALGAGLLAASRYRARVGHRFDLPPFEQRLSDAVTVTLVAAALVVPLLLLLNHPFPHSSATPPPDTPATVVTGHGTPSPVHVLPTHKPRHGSSITIPHLVVVLALVALAAVLLVAGYTLWRQLYRPATREVLEPYSHEPDEQEALAEAVDSGRRALLGDGDPRAAVIACYAAMERSLAGSGVARRASDSPQDLLERAAGSGLLGGPHAADLTALFREARYSTHPMDTTHRDRAAAALDAIAAQLAEAAARAAAEAEAGDPAAAPADRPRGRGPQPTTGAHR
ncbi:DUF4129 domain-containing protein [Streptomyces sp. NRRL F-5123]|uniref:DUF4129 domain-containing protein n=1 Tax=Streptomyces sp. NRRL F-5123 TaxID=1463856 RepID=UPI0006937458|nr:DUF4129 domain-containing protein [Streptomyces sp. NRRL F-5123]